MKKLLLSVAALIVATLMISLNEPNEVKKEGLSQDNAAELVKDSNIAS